MFNVKSYSPLYPRHKCLTSRLILKIATKLFSYLCVMFFVYWYIYLYVFIFVGVHVGACGNSTLRLRPTLVCQAKHVDIFVESFNDILKDIK